MSKFGGILFINIKIVMTAMVSVSEAVKDPEIVPRDTWGARSAKEVELVTFPVPYVVIHHSYNPAACNKSMECLEAMRWMQDFHQLNRSWWDIGYNFATCGDGKIYEGRGWGKVGAHAPRYNNISVGICLIGDWSSSLPPEQQLSATRQLIAMGVREGRIAEDYHLVGHRQVRQGTECPGDSLFEEIKRWPHFDPAPDYTKLKEGTPHPKTPPPEVDNKLRRRSASLLNKLL